MLFTTFDFIFIYLPIVFAIYFILNKLRLIRLGIAFLVVASVFFMDIGTTFMSLSSLQVLLLTSLWAQSYVQLLLSLKEKKGLKNQRAF